MLNPVGGKGIYINAYDNFQDDNLPIWFAKSCNI
jgi:hypothetical protein